MNKKEYMQEGYNLLSKFKDKSDMFSKDVAIIINNIIKEHFKLNNSVPYNRTKKVMFNVKEWKTVQEIIKENNLPKDVYGLMFQLRKLQEEGYVDCKRSYSKITWKKRLPPLKYKLKEQQLTL